MQKRLFPIGFHCGPAGHHDGLTEYINAIRERFTATVKSVDHYGILYEWHGHDDVIKVFRMDGDTDGAPFNFDVPLYHVSPQKAAEAHWQATLDNLPPEFSKGGGMARGH